MSGVRRWRLLALAAATAGATVALATVADDDDEAQYAHDGDEGDVLEDVHGDSCCFSLTLYSRERLFGAIDQAYGCLTAL